MSESELTTAERWVAARAGEAAWTSLVGPMIVLALIVVMAISSISEGLWALVLTFVFIVTMEWERVGLKRLLARRDEEIERLRSSDDSAQQVHQPDAPTRYASQEARGAQVMHSTFGSPDYEQAGQSGSEGGHEADR